MGLRGMLLGWLLGRLGCVQVNAEVVAKLASHGVRSLPELLQLSEDALKAPARK